METRRNRSWKWPKTIVLTVGVAIVLVLTVVGLITTTQKISANDNDCPQNSAEVAELLGGQPSDWIEVPGYNSPAYLTSPQLQLQEKLVLVTIPYGVFYDAGGSILGPESPAESFTIPADGIWVCVYRD